MGGAARVSPRAAGPTPTAEKVQPVQWGGHPVRWCGRPVPLSAADVRLLPWSIPRACDAESRHRRTGGGRRPTRSPSGAVVGALAWVLALMLWVALSEVTDYAAYDLGTASALAAGIELLILGGVVACVGATVIEGVRHELRRG